MHARQCGLYEAYTTTTEIPVVYIGVQFVTLAAQSFTIGEIKQAQATWWHLDDCITSKSVRAIMNNADSPSKARSVLNDYFLPLTYANIIFCEHRLSHLKMKHGEDPHVFFSPLKEVLNVLLMLGVEKDDRAVRSLMLRRFTREFEMVKSAMIIHFSRDREAIETHIRNAYLNFSVQSKAVTSTG